MMVVVANNVNIPVITVLIMLQNVLCVNQEQKEVLHQFVVVMMVISMLVLLLIVLSVNTNVLSVKHQQIIVLNV
jgi:hypothetical protein